MRSLVNGVIRYKVLHTNLCGADISVRGRSKGVFVTGPAEN